MAQRLIYERAVLREIANTAGGVFVALFAILLTTQLVRLLGQAAGGKIGSEAVLALLGFASLFHLPMILSLTLFVSVLMTLTRSYRDSEMVVWFSTGLPLTAWIRPILRFAAPLVLAIGALSLVLSPWANGKSGELRERFKQRDDIAQMSPGSFRESAGADRVFFVESAGDTDEARNIFVSSRHRGRLGVMMSSSGYQETAANGDRFVVLVNGRHYEGQPGTAEFQVMEFEKYAIRIEAREARAVKVSPRQMSLFELFALWNDAAKGELLWRLGIPLSALTLSLLAVPLSFVNPRAGRTNNLVMALLTFMIYSNMVSVSQAWVAQGRLPFAVGFWAVHALMFVLLVLLFYRRIAVYSWFGRP